MIIVNARFLTQKISGVQRVCIEWSKLIRRESDDIYFVTPRDVIHEELFDELRATKIGNNRGHIWEQIDLPKYLRKNNNPLLVSFSATGPIFYRNQVITIHDVAFIVNPKWYGFKFRLLYTKLIPLLAKRSKHILTVSDFSRQSICDTFGIKSNKVSFFHLGINKEMYEYGEKSLIRSKPFILSVSSVDPRKNFSALSSAYNLMRLKEDYDLVVVGNLYKHFGYLDLDPNIIFVQGVSDKDLVRYYKEASLFVYPSIYEGFGLPIIESLANGTRVACSNIPIFKETVGEFNVAFFDPSNPAEIAQVLDTILSKGTRIVDNTIVKRVRDKFNWSLSSSKIYTILKELS